MYLAETLVCLTGGGASNPRRKERLEGPPFGNAGPLFRGLYAGSLLIVLHGDPHLVLHCRDPMIPLSSLSLSLCLSLSLGLSLSLSSGLCLSYCTSYIYICLSNMYMNSSLRPSLKE